MYKVKNDRYPGTCSAALSLGLLRFGVILPQHHRLGSFGHLPHFILVDQPGQRHEAFLHVRVVLDGSAEVLYLVLPAPLHYLRLADPPLEIALVAQQHYDGLVGLGSADVVPLLFDVFEGPLAAEVEHHEDAMAALEVGGDDRPVFFLSGRVPDV